MNSTLKTAIVTAGVLLTEGSKVVAAAPITFKDLLARPRQTPTQVIAYGAHAHQFGELWLPPAGGGPRPVVLLVHGGCWLADLPGTELVAYMAADLRDRGYAVWSIDYRRIGDAGGGYPATFLDAAAAADMLGSLAQQHSLDLSRVIAVGHSAGGHLAMWIAGRRSIAPNSPLHNALPLAVHGVVSLAGINDLLSYRASGPDACGGPATIDALTSVASRPDADVYADTSPASMLPIGVPLVVVSGALDQIVPPHFGESFAASALTHGDRVEIRTIAGAGHFELVDPASQAWGQIVLAIAAVLK